MLWKLFAIAMVVLFVTGLTPHARDIFDLVGLPIEVIGCVGVVAYAFRCPTSQTRAWAASGWLFAGWSVVIIAVGATRGATQGLPLYAIAPALLFAGVWLYPTWLALHRLGRARYA